MIECVTIIGLGLIGGSIAKALREKCNVEKIIGIDSHEATIQQALQTGVLSYGATDVISEVSMSDIVFICTPVGKTIEWIKKVLPIVKPTCTITDVGSTKSQLIGDIEKISRLFHFVGGHPMAGSEKSGFTASKPHLFENAYYIIVPCAKSSAQDIEMLTSIVRCFGSIPVTLSPTHHDKVTGAISHVPHVISAALVNMVNASDNEERDMQKLAAGGFKDITRIASSNPEMWHNICCSNQKAVVEILDNYIDLLNEFKSYLSTKNDKAIYDFFDSAKQYRDSMASKITGLIPGTYELIIDVVDRPGIIGEVATLLGENNINIKNINISNSREFEGGVLIISLPDTVNLEKASGILAQHGYKITNRNK